jgi:hypothetical protein
MALLIGTICPPFLLLLEIIEELSEAGVINAFFLYTNAVLNDWLRKEGYSADV